MLPRDDRPKQVKILILEKLPEDNYQILKYLVQFLSKVCLIVNTEIAVHKVIFLAIDLIYVVFQVMDRCDLNKMTSSNLAVVFGPNLVWAQTGQMSLSNIGPINMFTDFVLTHQESIFII